MTENSMFIFTCATEEVFELYKHLFSSSIPLLQQWMTLKVPWTRVMYIFRFLHTIPILQKKLSFWFLMQIQSGWQFLDQNLPDRIMYNTLVQSTLIMTDRGIGKIRWRVRPISSLTERTCSELNRFEFRGPMKITAISEFIALSLITACWWFPLDEYLARNSNWAYFYTSMAGLFGF